MSDEDITIAFNELQLLVIMDDAQLTQNPSFGRFRRITQ